MASYLLRLAEDSPGKSRTLDLPIGRQDLADYLGLTIETTCRVLSDLKASGIVSMPHRRQIVVGDIRALEAVAEGDCRR